VKLAEFVLDSCRRARVRPSLRHFVELALGDFRDWKRRLTQTHWKTLVRSAIAEETSAQELEPVDLRGAKAARNQAAVLSIWPKYSTYEDRLAAFTALTKRGRDSMYRALRELIRSGKMTAG